MNTLTISRGLLLFLAFRLCAVPVAGQDSAFTYQGQLRRAGNPANGVFELQFRLWDADGIEGIGAPVSPALVRTVAVSNGLFTTQLDFGTTPFSGALLWMAMGVRTNGAGTFTPLVPRQPVTATPYAIRAAIYGGPVADTQLPQNVARLDVAGDFSGPVSFQSTSNALRIGVGGTAFNRAQAGSLPLGSHAGGVKAVTHSFPTPFNTVPRVLVTVRGADGSEVFAAATGSVTTNDFKVNVLRSDLPSGAWAQNLFVDWLAWE